MLRPLVLFGWAVLVTVVTSSVPTGVLVQKLYTECNKRYPNPEDSARNWVILLQAEEMKRNGQLDGAAFQQLLKGTTSTLPGIIIKPSQLTPWENMARLISKSEVKSWTATNWDAVAEHPGSVPLTYIDFNKIHAARLVDCWILYTVMAERVLDPRPADGGPTAPDKKPPVAVVVPTIPPGLLGGGDPPKRRKPNVRAAMHMLKLLNAAKGGANTGPPVLSTEQDLSEDSDHGDEDMVVVKPGGGGRKRLFTLSHVFHAFLAHKQGGGIQTADSDSDTILVPSMGIVDDEDILHVFNLLNQHGSLVHQEHHAGVSTTPPQPTNTAAPTSSSVAITSADPVNDPEGGPKIGMIIAIVSVVFLVGVVAVLCCCLMGAGGGQREEEEEEEEEEEKEH